MIMMKLVKKYVLIKNSDFFVLYIILKNVITISNTNKLVLLTFRTYIFIWRTLKLKRFAS